MKMGAEPSDRMYEELTDMNKLQTILNDVRSMLFTFAPGVYSFLFRVKARISKIRVRRWFNVKIRLGIDLELGLLKVGILLGSIITTRSKNRNNPENDRYSVLMVFLHFELELIVFVL